MCVPAPRGQSPCGSANLLYQFMMAILFLKAFISVSRRLSSIRTSVTKASLDCHKKQMMIASVWSNFASRASHELTSSEVFNYTHTLTLWVKLCGALVFFITKKGEVLTRVIRERRYLIHGLSLHSLRSRICKLWLGLTTIVCFTSFSRRFNSIIYYQTYQ